MTLSLSLSQEFEKQLVEITQTQEKIQAETQELAKVEIEEKLTQQFKEQLQTELDTKVQEVEHQKQKV